MGAHWARPLFIDGLSEFLNTPRPRVRAAPPGTKFCRNRLEVMLDDGKVHDWTCTREQHPRGENHAAHYNDGRVMALWIEEER